MSEEKVRPVSGGYLLEFTVFACGALVMIYEINGSRIVAPYIGTSTYVWTSLIGIILAALSLGYWIGGRIADRRPDVKVLALAIFAAAMLVSVTTLLKDVILTFVGAFPAGLELRSIIASLSLFAPASVALGFVIPYATKLRILSLADSGKTVGRLYALSTIGSIVGTFAAGFFLIPYIGSTRTLYFIAGSLFVLAIALGGIAIKQVAAAAAVLVIAIASNELTLAVMSRSANLVDTDTTYARVRIFDTVHQQSGRPIKVLATDPHTVQSGRFIDGDDTLALDYTRYYHLVRHLRPEFNKVLMIGGAGYSFPQDFVRTYQAASIDVVEIDPGITELAREHFGLADHPRMNVIHNDGRIFLNNAPAGAYDAVMMDAFGSSFSVPFQLATQEAATEVHRVTNDDGVVIFNIGSAVTGPASLFLQSQLAAYRELFPFVTVFKVRPSTADDRLQNLILVASKRELAPMADDPELSRMLATRIEGEIPVTVPAATDDLSPVERYLSIAQGYQP